MKLLKNSVADEENTDFIYSGLNNISKQGRKRLKKVAQSLIALQSSPGTPVPDHIRRDIMQDSAGKLV